MVQSPTRNPKLNQKLKSKTQDHITQFEKTLSAAKKIFLQKLNENVAENCEVSSFEMIEQIGSGAFGVVIVARHTWNQELYALKLIEKKVTVLKSQISHVKNEVKLLSCTEFEFLIKMDYFFKDNVYLYIGMPFINGGEMTTHLGRLKKFDEKLSKFYVAQVVLSLQYLHYMGIVYRDLKPENICINRDGYIKLCDFGFSKKIDSNRTYSFCGTPGYVYDHIRKISFHSTHPKGQKFNCKHNFDFEIFSADYLAPEVILHLGYSYSVDFWTLGIFLYEINAGYPPFADEIQVHQYDKIVKGKFHCPIFFSKELVDLSQKLIVVDRSSRFGCLKGGYNDIKLHEWFDDLDWNAIVAKKVKPIFIPKVDTTQIGANFIKQSHVEIRKTSIDEYSHLFNDFN